MANFTRKATMTAAVPKTTASSTSTKSVEIGDLRSGHLGATVMLGKPVGFVVLPAEARDSLLSELFAPMLLCFYTSSDCGHLLKGIFANINFLFHHLPKY